MIQLVVVCVLALVGGVVGGYAMYWFTGRPR